MKAKVVKEFRDRTEDLKLRKKGTALEVSKERAVELEGLGLVKLVEEKTKQTDKKNANQAEPTVDQSAEE